MWEGGAHWHRLAAAADVRPRSEWDGFAEAVKTMAPVGTAASPVLPTLTRAVALTALSRLPSEKGRGQALTPSVNVQQTVAAHHHAERWLLMLTLYRGLSADIWYLTDSHNNRKK